MSNYLLPSEQVCASYSELRFRVTDLMRNVSTEQAQTVVPHCPQWTIKECLAHMIGVPEDVINGQMDGVTTDAWTDRQVQRHAHDSIEDLLSIWDKVAPVFEPILHRIPQPVLSQFMFDQVNHEHDIRTALHQPGYRDSLAVAAAEGFLRDALSRQQNPDVANLATSSISGFEFLRTLSGRRSRAQIVEAGFDLQVVATFIESMPFNIPETEVSDD